MVEIVIFPFVYWNIIFFLFHESMMTHRVSEGLLLIVFAHIPASCQLSMGEVAWRMSRSMMCRQLWPVMMAGRSDPAHSQSTTLGISLGLLMECRISDWTHNDCAWLETMAHLIVLTLSVLCHVKPAFLIQQMVWKHTLVLTQLPLSQLGEHKSALFTFL